jgi:hypothetical protein
MPATDGPARSAVSYLSVNANPANMCHSHGGRTGGWSRPTCARNSTSAEARLIVGRAVLGPQCLLRCRLLPGQRPLIMAT